MGGDRKRQKKTKSNKQRKVKTKRDKKRQKQFFSQKYQVLVQFSLKKRHDKTCRDFKRYEKI